MGVALPRHLRWPNIAENSSENFIDHKLLDAEGILKNSKLYFFSKMGVSLSRPSGWPNIMSLKIILKIFIDH